MLNRRKPMNKIGRRGRMNAKANVAGDKVITAAGIDWCELHYPGICIGRALPLQRAHRLKRRNCDAAELERYCVSCTACHLHIERLPEKEMFQIVTDAIQRREP